jgi:hypothetical protein
MGLTPTKSYEDTLGDGLETVLASGAGTLAEIARGLNELNVHGPSGQSWTPELLEAEFKRLAG